MRPIFEPTPTRTIAGSAWDIDQLERRPSTARLENGPWIYVGAGGGAPDYDFPWEGTVRFRLTMVGETEIGGTAEGGVPPSRVFTLPVGYRPDIIDYTPIAVDAGTALAAMETQTDGEVFVLAQIAP